MKLVRFGESGKERWDKGKGCDTFGPLGPWLVTRDEIADPQALDMWREVVGTGQQPEPVYLRACQTMRLGITGLGEQRQRTIDASVKQEAQ